MEKAIQKKAIAEIDRKIKAAKADLSKLEREKERLESFNARKPKYKKGDVVDGVKIMEVHADYKDILYLIQLPNEKGKFDRNPEPCGDDCVSEEQLVGSKNVRDARTGKVIA